MSTRHVVCLAAYVFAYCSLSASITLSKDTLVNFKSEKVQNALEVLVKAAQTCTMRVRATPADVQAYFTNIAPTTFAGRCFATCMLESSGIFVNGQINREKLLHLAAFVNGPQSRVVQKLASVSKFCLESLNSVEGRCAVASTYNDCLNDHMTEFSFPRDIAEEVIRKMPFNLVHPHYVLSRRSNNWNVKGGPTADRVLWSTHPIPRVQSSHDIIYGLNQNERKNLEQALAGQ